MERLTELRRQRATAQLLRPARRSPAQIVKTLLVVQAQDHRQARIALWTRSSSMTHAAIDRALAGRELVIAWLNRGTLHLVCADDYAWMLALTAPTQTTSNLTRLRQLGVTDPERSARAVERALGDGPLTQPELRRVLAGKGLPSEGQAFPHSLGYVALRGRALRCARDTWVLTEDWLGPQPKVDRDRAVRELGRRYAKAHAPAAPEDLAWWAGLPMRDARAALEGVKQRPMGAGEPIPARLLPAWDEYLLGWKDRSFLMGAPLGELYRGGLIGPAATVDGEAIGKWRGRKEEGVAVELFERATADGSATLAAEAEALTRFAYE